MKKTIVTLLKCILTVALYMLFISLTGLIFSRDIPADKDSSSLFTGLLTVGIIQSLMLILLARSSALGRIAMGWLLSSVFFAINHLLNLMESLVFLRNIYPVAEQLAGTAGGLLMSLAMGFSVSFLFVQKNRGKESLPRFDWSAGLIAPWAGWTLLWFSIYFTAGILIPLAVPGVRDYYFGTDGAMDMSLVPVGYAMQIPRAAIWITLTIFLVKSLKGSNLEKSLLIALTYGVIMSSPLLLNNAFMPSFVRMAHLPEILFANILWGYLITGGVIKHFRKGD